MPSEPGSTIHTWSYQYLKAISLLSHGALRCLTIQQLEPCLGPSISPTFALRQGLVVEQTTVSYAPAAPYAVPQAYVPRREPAAGVQAFQTPRC